MRWLTSNAGSFRNGWLPRAARPMTLAVTEASTTMPKDWAAKSARMSSMAKNTPARGALKVAAMPPAAPQATRTRIRGSATLMIRPSVEPSAEPIWTIGPSRPTEPPPPIHSAEARAFTAATCGAMRPPAPRDGKHHLGYPVAPSFASEGLHERPVEQSRDHRREDDEPAAESGDVRVGDMAEAGVVAMPRQGERKDLDEPAEHDCPTAGPPAPTMSANASRPPFEERSPVISWAPPF